MADDAETTEETVWQGTPSQATNVPAWTLLTLAAIGATIGLRALRRASAVDGDLTERSADVFGWLIAIVWIGVALLVVMLYLLVRTTRYQLTTERLRVTTGIFSTETDEIELRRVRDFRVVRPFLARLLGLGHVHLISADSTTPRTTLRAVRNPDELQTTIRRIVQRLYKRHGVREIDVM